MAKRVKLILECINKGIVSRVPHCFSLCGIHETNHMQDVYFQKLMKSWGRCKRSLVMIQDLNKMPCCRRLRVLNLSGLLKKDELIYG